MGLGVSLMIVAVPLELRGASIMIGWGLEGALLVWLGHRLQSQQLRVPGLIMHIIVFAWLLVLYPLRQVTLAPDAWPFLNEQFLSYLGGTLTIAAALLVYIFSRPHTEERPQVAPAWALMVAVLVLCGVTEEMARLDVPSRFIMVWWGAMGLGLVTIGLRYAIRALAYAGMAIQAVVAAWLLTIFGVEPTPPA